MNNDQARWARSYQEALRRHLAQGPGADWRPATKLGHRAVALDLKALDVARAHAQSLRALSSAGGRPGDKITTMLRAAKFFAEAIVPIEHTHPAARLADICVSQLTGKLRRRTQEAAAANRQLKRGIVLRRAAEAAMKTSTAQHSQLLIKAQTLQAHLRRRTREILLAQERARRKTSRHLQNQIAQTLLAIEVRLLTLKSASNTNLATLKKGIAETQRLLQQSVQMMQRLARELGSHHEA